MRRPLEQTDRQTNMMTVPQRRRRLKTVRRQELQISDRGNHGCPKFQLWLGPTD